MADFREDEHVEARSITRAGGRYGGRGERHHLTTKEKFEDRSCSSGGVEGHAIKEEFAALDVSRTAGGVELHVLKEKFEEIDISRTSGHHHHHHLFGHHGRHHHHLFGHHGHHHAHHDHTTVVHETIVEEDFNSRTGEYHKKKTILTRDESDDD